MRLNVPVRALWCDARRPRVPRVGFLSRAVVRLLADGLGVVGHADVGLGLALAVLGEVDVVREVGDGVFCRL